VSQRNSEYARLPNEAYYTPSWVTEALCDAVDLPRVVWEPAAGNGAIKRVLEARGHQVHATDLNADTALGIAKRDFLLSALVAADTRGIVSNPPYGCAQQFVERAIALMKATRGMVAMLLRVDWDSAKTRSHLFRDCPAWGRKIVLTKRIRWIEGSTGSPSENHAWHVWSWRHRGHPTIGYAP
jgi:hypothetical protein